MAIPLRLTDFEPLQRELAASGFNLFSVLAGRSLGAEWADGCVLLIGNTGRKLWRRMPIHWFAKQHPLDAYSYSLTRELVARNLPEVRHTTLFPQIDKNREMPVLQQLGQLAGWHHDSPLGIGISAEHGLWFAYRAVVFLHRRADVEAPAAGRSPCQDCVDQPCVNACPANALLKLRPPDMQRCTAFRIESDSDCQSRCVARMACPVGLEWRYGDEQIAYHYNHSLRSIKQWLSLR